MMKHLLLLLAFPIGLWAYSPTSIMSPKIYDLTGYIEPEQTLVSMINHAGEPAEFNLNTRNNFLTITSEGDYYYAALLDTEGKLSFLYLGPESKSPLGNGIEEIPDGLSPVQSGVLTGGGGAVLSVVGGFSCMAYGLAYWLQDPWDNFTQGMLWMIVGSGIMVYGTIVSAAAGVATGVTKSIKENKARGNRKSISNQDKRGIYHVIVPVTEDEIPSTVGLQNLKDVSVN